jgi:DNA-binding LacI/PurR family transcriptional regulator
MAHPRRALRRGAREPRAREKALRKKRTRSNKMAEVARRAGVSLSTVSRALAGSPLISDDTRNLVRSVAERLDYRVDAAGSSLRTGLTRTAGVVIPLTHAETQHLSDPFFLEILGAIADELAARSYNMLLAKVTHDPSDWITSAVRSRRADGVIVIGQSLHHAELNALSDADVPLVVWGAQLPAQRYATVGSDNEQGGYSATRHLLEQGCRDIVFLGDSAVPEVAARLTGYARALREAGRPREARFELCVRFGSDRDTAHRAVAALLDADAAFDGVVACSDVFAMSAVQALLERGRRVPADCAVVGYDDIPFASLVTPPLTTVRQNCREGARQLVDNLMRAIGGERPSSAVLPTQIVVRASSQRERYLRLPSIRARRASGSMRSGHGRRDRGAAR